MNDEELAELREKAFSMGITQARNMKEETLIKKMAELDVEPVFDEPIKQPKPRLLIIGQSPVNLEWLESLANQYGFTKLVYSEKFKAFQCYVGGNHVDWININELSMLNGKGKITDIKVNYSPVSKDKRFPLRGIINLPWRK
jgi:hypothetical protein